MDLGPQGLAEPRPSRRFPARPVHWLPTRAPLVMLLEDRRQALLQAFELEGPRPVDVHALGDIVQQRVVRHRPERIAGRVHDRLPAELAQVLRELEGTERAAAALGRKPVGHQQRGLLRLHDELRS